MTPHILIEGRPALTKRLWESCRVKPIVLSSRPGNSPVYFAAQARKSGDFPDPPVRLLLGIGLIPGFGSVHPDLVEHSQMAELATDLLKRAVASARVRFKLGPGEKVRIVVAGSQGSLWSREHSNVAVGGYPFPPEGDALRLLGLSAQSRSFVRHLDTALGGLSGAAEVRWLADAFPDMRPTQTCSRDDLLEVAALARTAMEAGFSDVSGAVPLLYTRRSPSRHWQRFNEPSHKNAPDSPRAPVPYRTTGQLIQQYKMWPEREGLDCVLVKVLAVEAGARDRCDNPIIGAAHLEQAREAGISAVLLDRRFGIVDVVDQSNYVKDFTAWVREQTAKRLRDAQAPRIARLRKRASASIDQATAYFKDALTELNRVLAGLPAPDPAGPGRMIDLTDYDAIKSLLADLRQFLDLGPAPGPSADRQIPAPSPLTTAADYKSLSNAALIGEINDAFGHFCTVLGDATRRASMNARDARSVVENMSYNLARMLSGLRELMWRGDGGNQRRVGRARRALRWLHAAMRRMFGGKARLTGGSSRSLETFVSDMREYDGLERALQAGLDRPLRWDALIRDYPPVYAV